MRGGAERGGAGRCGAVQGGAGRGGRAGPSRLANMQYGIAGEDMLSRDVTPR